MLSISTNFRWLSSSLLWFIWVNQLVVIENQASPLLNSLNDQQTNQQKLYSSNSNQQQFNRYFGQELKLHKINSASSSAASNATCNDGSPAGYYVRLNRQSKRWIIYLQGGFFCASEETCRERWLQNPELMSSKQWAEFRTVNGMLSNDPRENPYLWNANHIFVPYCTSDAWSGRQPLLSTGANPDSYSSSFSFMGSAIVKAVVESLYEELPLEYSLYQSKYILLAGDSAGALGVMLNLDRVVNEVTQKSYLFRKTRAIECSSSNSRPTHCLKPPRQTPVVRGLADSGWFLDKESTSGSSSDPSRRERRGMNDQEEDPTTSTGRFSALDYMRQAFFQWNAQVPSSCAERHPEEPWRCYFGYLSYTTLKTPLFVVQWLYDEVQFLVDNISRSGSAGIAQRHSGDKVLEDLRESLENVTALFAPSCFSHSLVIKPSWNHVNVNGFKLPYILDRWEEQSMQAEITGTNDEQTGDSLNKSRLVDEIGPDRQSTGGRSKLSNELSSSKQGQETRGASNSRQSTGQSGRPGRTRKRKRNNNQRAKQVRPRFGFMGESAVPTMMMNSDQLSFQTYPADLSSSSSTSSPLQDLLPLVDGGLSYHESSVFSSRLFTSNPISSINPRSSRSTLEEPLMVANQMPDDSSNIPSGANYETTRLQNSKWSSIPVEVQSSPTEEPSVGSSRLTGKLNDDTAFFRLIDSCGTPQCNKNCPLSEMDFDLAKII